MNINNIKNPEQLVLEVVDLLIKKKKIGKQRLNHPMTQSIDSFKVSFIDEEIEASMTNYFGPDKSNWPQKIYSNHYTNDNDDELYYFLEYWMFNPNKKTDKDKEWHIPNELTGLDRVKARVAYKINKIWNLYKQYWDKVYYKKP